MKYTGIGYVQGMNFIGASLLYHSSPKVALIVLTYLFEDCELCDLYKDNLNGLSERTWMIKNLLALKCKPLYDHMVNLYDVKPEIIVTEWILDLFSHTIPLAQYKDFMNRFIKHKWKYLY